MLVPTQKEYINELKYITDELYTAVFSLQCLYMHSSGQIPALKDCPPALTESCWQHTQLSLKENLQDLAQVTRFLEASVKEPQVTPV